VVDRGEKNWVYIHTNLSQNIKKFIFFNPHLSRTWLHRSTRSEWIWCCIWSLCLSSSSSA